MSIIVPLQLKVNSRAPAWLTRITFRRLLLYMVLTNTLERNFERRLTFLSVKPWLGARACGWLSLKKPRHNSSKEPDLYITPAVTSTLISSLFAAGRTDWKYPRQSSTPPPILILPVDVKKDLPLELAGYRRITSSRMAMLSDWHWLLTQFEKDKNQRQPTCKVVKIALSAEHFPAMNLERSLNKEWLHVKLHSPNPLNEYHTLRI